MQNWNGADSSGKSSALTEIAPGVAYMTTVFANIYFVNVISDGSPAWVLVDTGLSGFAGRIRRIAAERYGQDARPRAIIPTPAFDQTGGGMFPDVFTNYQTFTAVSQVSEETGVRAYKGKAGNLRSNDKILTTALRIHSVEARHVCRDFIPARPHGPAGD